MRIVLEAPADRGRLPVAAALLLFAVAAAVYAGTLHHGFVWDDQRLIKPISEEGLRSVLDVRFASGYFRPAAIFSLWLDARIAPFLPQAYHLTNLLIHGLNTVLLFAVLGNLSLPVVPCFWGALFFAVNPVHTEAVAFVSGRTDLLACAFVLASFLCWLKTRRNPANRLAFPTGLAAFTLALLSKEVAFMLPGALLAADALAPTEGVPWWRRNRRWLAGWAACAVMALSLRHLAGVGFGMGTVSGGEGHAAAALARPVLFPLIWLEYLRLLVIPWPLSPYYSPDFLGPSFLNLASIPILFTGIFLTGRSLRPLFGYAAVVWAAVFLLPVSGIVPLWGRILAERYLYLPSVGAAILAAALVHRGRETAVRQAFRVLLPAAAAAMAVMTVSYSEVWKDELSLWRHASGRNPREAYLNFMLGASLYAASDLDGAISHLKEAVDREPRSAKARGMLGRALMDNGRTGEGLALVEASLATDPSLAENWIYAGNAFYDKGEFGKAAHAFGRASSIVRDDPQLFNMLGRSLGDLGRLEDAVRAFSRALELNPGYAEARFNLALTFAALGRRGLADIELGRLERDDPRMAVRLRGLLGPRQAASKP